MKKRILACIMAVCLLLGSLPPVTVRAAEGSAGGVISTSLTWHYDGRGTLDFCGTGSIPDYADAEKQPWAAYARQIETVVMDAGVTSIGSYAFSGCTKLSRVELAETVQYIKAEAFSGCTALEDVTLPLSLTSIAGDAFAGCTGLQTVRFRNGWISINATAFSGVTAKAIYPASTPSWTEADLLDYGGSLEWIPASAQKDIFICGSASYFDWGIRKDGTLVISTAYGPIGSYSRGNAPWYSYREYITGLEFHGSVGSIGAYAFADLTRLKSCYLDGLNSLGEHAFDGCTALESVFLMPTSYYLNIGAYAFYGCKALREASFPLSASIGDYAFAGCTSLKDIHLNGLGSSRLPFSAKEHSFTSVNATVHYPKGVQGNPGTSRFGGTFAWEPTLTGRCGQEARWSYDEETCTLTLQGTGAIGSYVSGSVTPWGLLNGEIRHVVVEDGITVIPSYTFEYLGSVQDIRLPETLRILAPNAFNDCESLNDLLIPASVASLTYNDKFNRCGALTDLYFGGTAEQWEAIPYHENAEQVSTGNVFTMHFLEYYESTATCTEDGLEAHYAFPEPTVYTHVYSADGKRLEQPVPMPAYGHDYEATITEPTCTLSGYIRYVCSRCSNVKTEHPPALGHDFGAWILVTPATCQQEGEQVRECARCQAQERCTIAVTDHVFESYVSDHNATCTEDGTRTSKCTTCELTSTVTDEGTALGHAFHTYISNGDATCEEDGTKTAVCERCAETDTVSDPGSRLGHTYTAVILRPNCDQGGYTTYTCQICMDSYVSDHTPALGHSFTSYVSNGNATCEADGTKTAKCDRCQEIDTITDVGSAVGHQCADWYDMEPATCTEDGLQRRECQNCGYYEERIAAAYGHDYEIVVTEPTCTLAGYSTHTCTRCADAFISDQREALGHDYTAVVVEPTCMDWGYTMHCCTRCADSYANGFVSALGHEWQTHETEPTCTEGGFTTHCCVRCGEQYVDSHLDALGHAYQNGCCVRCGAEDGIIASGDCGADAAWQLYESGCLRFSGKGKMKDYTYKSEMPWYAYREQIVSVVLEEGVTSIGDYAFYGMPQLERISIASTVTDIGDYAFKNAPKINNVVLPEVLTSLGDSAFYACTSLTSIEIPAALWTIKPYTFKNCTALAEVTFHEGNLLKISDGAFYNTALTELRLPDCLDILDTFSFKNCAKLATIELGGGLTELREAVFYGTAIPTITIPEGITKVGPYVFKNCVKLESIELPESLTSVGEASFYACTSLKSLDLPDAVTRIGSYAFRKCLALDSVDFPESLVNIGESSFYGCERLHYLNIPGNVTTIQSYAFKGCTGLVIVVLPDSLNTIGDSAFHTCTDLDEITIPSGVTGIGEYCFSGSTGINSIYFEGDAPAIGTGAFNKLTATVYYPGDNATWTDSVRQNYGGKLTWKTA